MSQKTEPLRFFGITVPKQAGNAKLCQKIVEVRFISETWYTCENFVIHKHCTRLHFVTVYHLTIQTSASKQQPKNTA